MAREKTRRDSSAESPGNPLGHFDDEELVKDLIGSINKEAGNLIAYNLSTDQSPTHVKRWISTGCVQLDYAISGRRDGGLPEGRIIEIYGPPSIGKSHLGVQVAKSAQKMGGIAVYVDTENATNPENLAALGLDVSKRFVYTNPGCVEDVFTVIESTILKTRSMAKDVPVVVIWDSLAASPAKAELEADYDKDAIGLQARALGKGFRKITQVIGNSRATLIVMNQIRVKIGCVNPDALIQVRQVNVPEETIRIVDLFQNRFLRRLFSMEIDQPEDVIGFEVKSFDFQEQTVVWKPITRIVRKPDVIPYNVAFDQGTLQVAPNHLFWSQVSGVQNWRMAEALANETEVWLYTETGSWELVSITKAESETPILDIEVQDTHCYFSNGFLSHNTMYGDPTTTPGGNALPFYASVRIQLNGGGVLGEKDAPYGIVVTARIKKNRVSKPFRKCEFEIRFGQGIFEGEQVFDRLRENGPEVIGSKRVAFEGSGAWKTFSVRDVETDKAEIEEKFYKPDFNRIWKNPEFKPYVDDLIERVFTKDAVIPTVDAETGEVS